MDEAEVEEIMRKREARGRAQVLEMVSAANVPTLAPRRFTMLLVLLFYFSEGVG